MRKGEDFFNFVALSNPGSGVAYGGIPSTEREKIYRFALERTLLKSEFDTMKRGKLFQDLIGMVGDADSFGDVLVREGLKDRFYEHANEMFTSRGKSLRKEVQSLVPFSMEGTKLSSPVSWSQIYGSEALSKSRSPALEDVRNIFGQIEDAFGAGELKGRGKVNLQQVQQAHFKVGSWTHSSKDVFMSMNIEGQNPFAFKITVPSPEGFSAQSSLGFTGKVNRSDAIFASANKYIVDAAKEGPGWKSVQGGMTDFVGAQINIANQFMNLISEEYEAGKINDKRMRQINKMYQGEVSKLQREAGHASVLRLAGKERWGDFVQGRMDTLKMFTKAGVKLAPGLKNLGIDRMSTDAYDILQAYGAVPGGSANTIAKGYGLTVDTSEFFGEGVGRVGLHKEPTKAIKDLYPVASKDVKIPGTSIDRFKMKQVHNLGEFGHNNYLVTFLDPKRAMTGAGSEGFKVLNIMGEGSAFAKKSLYESGALDSVHFASYKIKGINPAGGEGLVSKQVRSFVEAAYGEGDRSARGLGRLAPDELLGLDSAGKPVRVQGSHVAEQIVDVTAKEGGELSITTGRKVLGMVDGKAREHVKYIGGPRGLLKSVLSPVGDPAFQDLLMTAAPGAKDAQHLTGVVEMALRMDGAFEASEARYVMSGGVIASAGMATAEEGRGKAYEALKRIAGMTNESLADEVVKHSTKESFGGKLVDYLQQQVSGKQEFDAFYKKYASSFLAPYTEWSNQIGGALGKDMASDAAAIKSDLSSLVGHSAATQTLASNTPLVTQISARAASYGAQTGQGVKGSIEPRMIELLRSNKLTGAYDELVSRTTNFGRPIGELALTLKGMEQGGYMKQLETITLDEAMRNKDLWGTGRSVNVQMPKAAVEAGLPSHVYVPGRQTFEAMDTSMSLMGEFVPGGGGSARPKLMRETFQEFFENVSMTKQMTSNAAKGIAQDFEQSVRNAMLIMYQGLPGGGAHGAVRNIVEGSLFLPNQPVGSMLLEAGEKTRKQIKDFQNLFAEEKFAKAGVGFGEVKVISKKATNKMFGDAMVAARKAGDTNLEAVYRAQRDALLQGDITFSRPGSTVKEPITGLAVRHPVLGARSGSPVMFMTDMAKESTTASESYVRSFETQIEGVSIKAGKNVLKEKGPITSAVMQSLNYDFDGDHFVLAAMGREESSRELMRMMTSGQNTSMKHALRYSAIKEQAKHIASTQGRAMQKTLGQSLETMAFQASAEAAAAAGPKNIAPMVSNIFSEMKSAISRTDAISRRSKYDLLKVFEAAEQVPISSKHLVEAPAYGKFFQDKSSNLITSLDKGAQHRAQASTDFMQALLGDERYLDVYQNDKLVERVDTLEMRNNLNKVMDDYAGNQEMRSRYKAIRQKITDPSGRWMYKGALDEGATSKKMLDMFRSEGVAPETIKEMNRIADKSFASVERGVIGEVNQSVQKAGREAAKKLPTKGIVAAAFMAGAGLLAIGAGAMTLGPSFQGGGGGSQRTIEDFSMFKSDLNPMLNQPGMGASPATYVQPGNAQTLINMPNHNVDIPGMARVAAVGAGLNGGGGRVEVYDNRDRIDQHTISRIKNEII